MTEDNAAKYGDKEHDLISQAYREGCGHSFCSLNARKYLKRFTSQSDKSNNLADLHKAQDYINRMIENYKA